MALFGGKKKSSVGIDIGTASIKVLELSQKEDKVELTNYGKYEAAVGSTIQSSSVRLSANEVSETIQQIMNEARIKAVEVAMAIPVFAGFSILISLPNMSDEELEQAVVYEAKKYIPLPLSEVQFEWVRVGNGEEGLEVASSINILIVAVTNELINKYNNIAKLCGFGLKYLELDTFSLARSILSHEDNLALIINIGAQNTILSIVDNGWPVLTRAIEFSGYEFSRVLASSLGIDLGRAEQMKRREGVKAGEGILLPLIDSVFMEGERMINDYSSKKKVVVKKIVVSGGSARMPGLLEYITKTTDKKIVIGQPFHDIMYPSILEGTLKELAPSLDVAVGLALREFKK